MQPKLLLRPETPVRKRQPFDHQLPAKVGVVKGEPELINKNWYYPVKWRHSGRIEKVMAQRLELLE